MDSPRSFETLLLTYDTTMLSKTRKVLRKTFFSVQHSSRCCFIFRRWTSNSQELRVQCKEYTRGNQNVKAIFKLRGSRDRKELAHCAVLTVLVEEFSLVQYSALPSVEWQQRRRKHGRFFARLHRRRATWRSVVSLGRRSEACGNSPSYVGLVWTEHHESAKGLWVGGKV